MPKNPKYTPDEEKVLVDFNKKDVETTTYRSSDSVKASIYKQANEIQINQIYKLIYGQNTAKTDLEKTEVINNFFADLFNANAISWKVIQDNRENEQLLTLLTEYLKNTDFATKLWQTKTKAGQNGNYGLLISKENDSDVEYNYPNITPVRIVWKNSINDIVYEIEVEFDDNPYSSGNNTYFLRRHYSLINKKANYEVFLTTDDGVRVADDKIPENLKGMLNLTSQNLDWEFIPVAILKNNYSQTPRVKLVDTPLRMLPKFDEVLGIAPLWEKGSIAFTGSEVTAEDVEQQNAQFIINYLFKGFNQFKTIDNGGTPSNLVDNIMWMKPESIMQTLKATKDLIWTGIKEDLGLPSLNEAKSAQKTEAEVTAKNFLLSPIIDREKNFMEQFLTDFGKKFLIVLSKCHILETFPEFDPKTLKINLTFNLVTDQNVNTTIQSMSKLENQSSQPNKVVGPTNNQETESEDNDVTKQGWWTRFVEFFRRIWRGSDKS